MTIQDVIASIEEQNEEAVVYAQRVGGKWLPSSEVSLLLLPEEEEDLKTDEIAEKYCPGFEYFLEISLIIELQEDLESLRGPQSPEQKVEAIIHYAENDAF